MRARVNGEHRDLAEGITVAAVLDELGAPPSGVAVAVDGEIVPRAAWPTTPLHEDAAVEVLTAVQGG
ncbi:sulfur carrier protein ThiS [Solihabitans fulvus]|uniref:Sulfur carrier protein ThiS n=1 Tax=Solihabitans fulvus TaxID=1892852 RepID=A0A5B2XI60_9PSEU|nr:sulfur carrier protein ThiS [Solihabitans fulvus]KAA2262412.1 sulfur carrier protein ThiS [Solihabitans fulvus]